MTRCPLTALLCALLLVASCDLQGTGEAYPGASIYQPVARDFHFHYLEPPWQWAPVPTPSALVHLVVVAYGQFNPTNSGYTHRLQVSYAGGASDDLRAVAAARLDDERAVGRIVTRDVSEATARSGARGWQYAVRDDIVLGHAYARALLFRAASGKPVLFLVTGRFPLETQDVDDLVLSFAASPDPGTATPRRSPSDGSLP